MTELGPYGRELMQLTSNIEQEAQRRLNAISSTLRTRELRYYWIGPIRHFARGIRSSPHHGVWYLYNQYGALMAWENMATITGSCAVFNPKLMKFQFARTRLQTSDYYTFDENGAARYEKYNIMPIGNRLSTRTHDEGVLSSNRYDIETYMSLGEVRRRIGDIHLLVEAYEDGRGPAWFLYPRRGMLTRERLDSFIMSIPDSKLTSRLNLW